MTVLKRPDRKQRPWYYKFRRDGVLHKEAGFRTEREARDAEAAARLRAQKAETSLEFSQAVDLRLEYVQAYYPHELRNNITRLKKFAGWETLDCTEITTEMIRQRLIELKNYFFECLKCKGDKAITINDCKEAQCDSWPRRLQGMKPALVNKHLVALKSVFQLQFEEGRLPRNPCRGVKMMPVDRFIKYIPPVSDIEKVLALATEIDACYLEIIWQLAARVREVNRLPWTDVDFQRRQVRLWTRKKKGGNLTDRLVDMTDRCFLALKRARWIWKEKNSHSPYVFTNADMMKRYSNDPSRWNYDYRDKFFDRLCRQAGVRECGYHALRHLRASEMADQNLPLTYIRDQLGHEDIATTNKYLQSLGIKK